MKTLKLKLTFTEELLATSPGNPDVFATYIAANAPDAKTIQEEIADKGQEKVALENMTVFMRTEDQRPFIYDYHIKGFLKSACGFLNRAKETESKELTAYKKIIDGLIFIFPRRIIINATAIGRKVRPLRAQTAQGERVALACSESAPAGSTLEFEIKWYPLKKENGPDLETLLTEWLDFGQLNGLGQWRNASHGRFTYEIIS